MNKISEKILLIGMGFYNYEEKIKKSMEKCGNEVDLIFDMPSNGTFLKRCLSDKMLCRIQKQYQKRLLESVEFGSYAKIIVIVGRNLHYFFLEEIRKRKGTNAQLILYLWDDVKRVENFEHIKGLYDLIYSFDPNDCAAYGFQFLPLFYTDEFYPMNKNKEYDVFTAVFDYSDRMEIIEKIISQNINHKLHFIVNQGKYKYISSILTKKNKSQFIHYRGIPISKERNIEFIHRSKAMLDIQYKSQKGLTIRTLESVGCKIKLITTNQDIYNYDFYNNNNIFILDRNKPVMDWGFLDKPYVELPEDIYKKYSLDRWVQVILGRQQESYLIPQNQYGL